MLTRELTRDELLAEMSAQRPEPGELVYIERRGSSYAWFRNGVGAPVTGPDTAASLPDAWIYCGGPWPIEPGRTQAVPGTERGGRCHCGAR